MNDILNKTYTISDIVDVNSNLNYDKFTSQFALENSNTGVWDFHLKTNTVHYSKEAKKVLCLEDNHFSAFDWKNIIHPDDYENLISVLKKHYAGELPYYISEHRVLCNKGKYKWVKDSGRVIERDELGNPLRIIGTVCDISERKEREVEIVQNLEIITNQNNRLQNFAHIVTHNLKEYTGNFESLLEFYDAAETMKEKDELINHLKTVSNSLGKTIVNLNEIVSKQSSKKIEREKLNIFQCMEDTFKIMEFEIANKKATIINNVNPQISIYANRSYMESIIQNLASNALKYSHPDRKPVINIDSHLSEEDILSITIADNGIGVDLNKFGNDIFGLYRTFHGNENAEGVGLYLTKSQVETLGGSIDIKSEVNVGTTFTITMNIKNPE